MSATGQCLARVSWNRKRWTIHLNHLISWSLSWSIASFLIRNLRTFAPALSQVSPPGFPPGTLPGTPHRVYLGRGFPFDYDMLCRCQGRSLPSSLWITTYYDVLGFDIKIISMSMSRSIASLSHTPTGRRIYTYTRKYRWMDGSNRSIDI